MSVFARLAFVLYCALNVGLALQGVVCHLTLVRGVPMPSTAAPLDCGPVGLTTSPPLHSPLTCVCTCECVLGIGR